MTSAWTVEHVGLIDMGRISRVPLVGTIDRNGLEPGRLYWDMWPIQSPSGTVARVNGRELWMALSAPDRGDPARRHFDAKIRMMERVGDDWTDLGDVLPNLAANFDREWAGSALYDGERISLFFTAAGTSARPGGYQQRLFEAHAKTDPEGLPGEWTQPRPSLTNALPYYAPADAHEGEPGQIKAFRDPAYFRDPADGCEYLFFSASLAESQSPFSGAVGIARRDRGSWSLLPPLVHGDGVNNELERAHGVYRDGRYYIFWVTQSATFAPELRHAPNGLYGMVADSLFGDYRPLNGSGLVLANPVGEPYQTYSWFVSAELTVSSFVDFCGLDGEPPPSDPARARSHFGGVPAPLLRLEVDGDSCRLARHPFA